MGLFGRHDGCAGVAGRAASSSRVCLTAGGPDRSGSGPFTRLRECLVTCGSLKVLRTGEPVRATGWPSGLTTHSGGKPPTSRGVHRSRHRRCGRKILNHCPAAVAPPCAPSVPFVLSPSHRRPPCRLETPDPCAVARRPSSRGAQSALTAVLRVQLSDAVRRKFEEIDAELNAERARKRAAVVREADEARLAEIQDEIAALRAKMAALQARLADLESTRVELVAGLERADDEAGLGEAAPAAADQGASSAGARAAAAAAATAQQPPPAAARVAQSAPCSAVLPASSPAHPDCGSPAAARAAGCEHRASGRPDEATRSARAKGTRVAAVDDTARNERGAAGKKRPRSDGTPSNTGVFAGMLVWCCEAHGLPVLSVRTH